MAKEAAADVVLSVVVGSRLHGLYNDQSDWDIRGIFKHPAIDIISPFKNPGNNSHVEGDVDNTAYELREFVKLATHGNATILEVLWSNIVRESTPIGELLQQNRQKFLHSKRVYEAHRGYASNQMKKLNLYQPDDRTPKFAVAYMRVMDQCIQLLRTGDFSPQVVNDKDFLMEVKYTKPKDFNEPLRKAIWNRFFELETEAAAAYIENADRFSPDIPWIESLLEEAYLPNITKHICVAPSYLFEEDNDK